MSLRTISEHPRRLLGETGLTLPPLSFGASSLGQEFGNRIDFDQAVRCVRTAIDCGLNYIDTAAFYGRGMSEILLGRVLPDLRRDEFILSTKLGRYSPVHFDYSARRVVESVDLSLERMGVDYIDMMFCHDIEYAEIDMIVSETLPALRDEQKKGKVGFIGVSGYPMTIFKKVLQATSLDVILTYNHMTLQNDMAKQLIPLCHDRPDGQRRVGLINAAPFCARLLTSAPLPPWHKATPRVREVATEARKYCQTLGVDLAKLALQYTVSQAGFATCVLGTDEPSHIETWVEWCNEQIDETAIQELQKLFAPVHNWSYMEGRPENNDPGAQQDLSESSCNDGVPG